MDSNETHTHPINLAGSAALQGGAKEAQPNSTPSKLVGSGSSGSARQELIEAINAIPKWKRLLMCHLIRRKEWEVARAYNTIAAHAFNELGDDALFFDMRCRGDRAWATVYGLPNIPDQPRAERKIL